MSLFLQLVLIHLVLIDLAFLYIIFFLKKNMYLLFLALSYAKINDVVRDKYGLKYTHLAICANILLEGLL